LMTYRHMAICHQGGVDVKQFIRVMKALSDPNRVRVLKILETKKLCVCELKDLVGLAQSTVSKHLKVLEEAGLVDYHKEGSWFIYRLTNGEESDYASVMLENLKGWLDDEPQLQDMIARIPLVDRERSCAA
jgi:ArsR family transcriptional regulator